MRIAIFSHSSSSENIGGAERALLELIDGWKEFEPQLQIIVFSRSPEGLLQPQLHKRGIEVHTYPFESWVLPESITGVEDKFRTLRENSEFLSSAIEQLADFQPDFVLSNTLVSPWGALAAWNLGIPHIWFVHEYGTGHVFETGVDNTFRDISLLSSYVVASSETLKAYLEAWIPSEKISVIYPLPEIEEFEKRISLIESKQPSTSENDALTAVTVGQFSEIKGQKLLLEAAALLQDKGHALNAVFVGRFTEEDQQFVDAFVHNHGLKGTFRFTGEVAEPFVELLSADIGVVTAGSEGFGRATVEMMYAGLPVVASSSGATPELFQDARWNLLFEPDSPDSLANALAELISQPELRGNCSLESEQLAVDLIAKNSKTNFYQFIANQGDSLNAFPDQPPYFLRYWLTKLTAVRSYTELVSTNLPETNSLDYRIGNSLTSPLRNLMTVLTRKDKRGKE